MNTIFLEFEPVDRYGEDILYSSKFISYTDSGYIYSSYISLIISGYDPINHENNITVSKYHKLEDGSDILEIIFSETAL